MTTASSLVPMDRIAAAPISWGLCEVPGWGHQLSPERVLDEMRRLGLGATEFGPPGFLEPAPVARSQQLSAHGLRAVGGFLPVLLHDTAHDPLPEVEAFVDECLEVGAEVVVLAASTGLEGYEERPTLDDGGWARLLGRLDAIHDRVSERGLVVALHPHVGTMVESGDDARQVLAGSRIGLCLDTGHLAAAGADPVAIARLDPARVRHVHLKDVDGALAARVARGELGFADAVRQGMFCPLGRGDVDVAGLVTALEAAGYDGWYVLEQDTMLEAEPDGAGPVDDVRASLDFLTVPAATEGPDRG